MTSFFSQFVCGVLLCGVQLLAAIPWMYAVDRRAFLAAVKRPLTWALMLGGVLVAGALLAFFVGTIQDPVRLGVWGRLFGAVLHIQLTIDFFAIAFPMLLSVWPHGGAVALAAFREGIRQPMFWLIAVVAGFLMLFSPFLPYFTFGEDTKMVAELGYDMIMLSSVVFAVLAASMSISEEIEGRTAITVMSKPVSRRQFLVGKFVGILLAALLMIGMMCWIFTLVMWFKPILEGDELGNPFWVMPVRDRLSESFGESPANFVVGMGLWFEVVLNSLPGLIFGACQMMVLLSVAVALATRLPMIVNVVVCLVIFFLGHLTHLLVQISQGRFELIAFFAKAFDLVLPGLEYFDLSALIARDTPPNPRDFGFYILSVVLYAFLYSLIALLFGLILFEDRDLA